LKIKKKTSQRSKDKEDERKARLPGKRPLDTEGQRGEGLDGEGRCVQHSREKGRSRIPPELRGKGSVEKPTGKAQSLQNSIEVVLGRGGGDN